METALDLYERFGDEEGIASVLLPLGTWYGLIIGEPDKGLSLLERAQGIYKKLGDPAPETTEETIRLVRERMRR